MGSAHPGPKNPNWRGGRSVASNGYVLVRVGVGRPLADVRGYAYEHRVVAEQKIGRPLTKGEQVHHLDKNKQNNDPANLEVLTFDEHAAEHRVRSDLRHKGEENPLVNCACGCGAQLEKYDAQGRPRRYMPSHNSAGQPAPTMSAVIAALANGPIDRCSISRQTGIPKKVVACSLSRMKRSGRVENVARGMWKLREGSYGRE